MSFENVSLGYGRKTVLRDLSFELRSGDYVALVGPNGAGKTTLLRTLLGSLRPLSGRVVQALPLRWGYVPQVQTMDMHFPLTALDIVLMGRYRSLGLVRRPARSDRERAMQALGDVGIADLASRSFRDLSGGQRQRTLMARALASEPHALALDEPTNDMDIAAEKATMDLIDRLHEEHGLLIVMVSHLLNVVVNHVHRVAIVGEERVREGQVDEMVRPEVLSELYGVPVDVLDMNERRVVL